MTQEYHVQICHRQWVVWGYGPRPDPASLRGCMISPTESAINVGTTLVLLPFSLPARNGVEYDRVESWGWRFRGANSVDATSWRLAATREACLEQARKMVENDLEHEPARGRVFERALNDVREYAGGIL